MFAGFEDVTTRVGNPRMDKVIAPRIIRRIATRIKPKKDTSVQPEEEKTEALTFVPTSTLRPIIDHA